ncbi:NAD(P)H-dependent oxidoreductase [Alicyclobacillus tolerans]|uniref:NAD(P)H dehydrogenase (Quinone) n=1 Tax=Alicyclobacillus tolerans TaxID=90970 RepID=A0ABT9LTV8_9BACL|nr:MULTISPECIES: NAD(P)H-dependent oxidoreductase [Alicyclobacillus]MDP9727700.1 NAD(P)H dehydrogenase (quinone) [Alicyclobacillus tengchongensis]QRF24386.1 flavodoxin family protein [Alicyclobacillus sp. TC]
MKVYIVYDSENGHTEVLAKAIAEGARTQPQAEVFLHHVQDANPRDLTEMDAIIWGCPGHFGTISSGLKAWIDQLGHLWATGKLVGKVGAAFCTTATVHGGIEMTLMNLLTPMLHNGMIIVGLPGNVPENVLYGSYYGLGVTCPVEEDASAPMNAPAEEFLVLGRVLGRRVADVAGKLFDHA